MKRNDRYIYIKNGDVVTQLQRIAALADVTITSGPDAFLYDFLSTISDDRVFIVSQSGRNAVYHDKNITARVYKANGSIPVKFIKRILASLDLFVRLLLYRPTKIICGTGGGFLWTAYLLSRIYSIPIVHSRHNRLVSQHNGFLKRYAVTIDHWCIRRCTKVICHGPYLREQLKAIGVEPSKILEFDVGFSDLYQESSISTNIENERHSENRRVILYVGRIEREKGVIDLLEACVGLLSNHPDVIIIYVGKGSALEELQETVERYKLKDNVQLLGYINHERIVGIMRHSAFMVTPTRIEFPEGRCMSAMEALIIGLPVIAPKFGPFPFLVQHDINGLLYEPNSVSDLCEKILMLIDDPQRYSRLKDGARITGDKLMHPELTFGEAVHRAFSIG